MKELKSGVSRRQLLERAALAAGALPVLGSTAKAQQAGRGAPAGGPPPGPRVVQGGNGPIKVLLITQGHAFERGPFFDTFDTFGKEITYTHVEHPAADVFFDPVLGAPWDVFVLYDGHAGRETRRKADGTTEIVETEPPAKLKASMKALLQKGKGFVFFHHAVSSWVHTWPEYVEVMGSACDWSSPLGKIRGKDYPVSGFIDGRQQHCTVVDKTHPIMQGVGDGYDIVDEAYLCPVFEDSVHCLARTNYEPVKENFPMQLQRDPKWNPERGSNMVAWVKTAENSPVAYIQHGHDHQAWENPAFRTMLMNAMRWAASPEAMKWAAANPKKIFA
jgi:uncharacterized protein